MKLRDRLAAVSDYPRLRDELEKVMADLTVSQADCKQLEKRCEAFDDSILELKDALNDTQGKMACFRSALMSFCPDLDSAERLRQFYNCVSPQFDPDGFRLYFAAQGVCGIHNLYDYFSYEDARGLFEDMDGHALLNYLTAAHFDRIVWKIVPGTPYESATLLNVDRTTPEYQEFEKQIYANALKEMGFGDFLPQQNHEKVHQHQKKKEGIHDGR